LSHLKLKGYLSFIVSRYYLTATHSDKVREYILNNSKILKLLDFSSLLMFDKVGIHSSIMVLEKGSSVKNKIDYYKADNSVQKLDKLDLNKLIFTEIDQTKLTSNPWELVDLKISNLINKFSKISQRLDEICLIGTGVKSGYDKIFVVDDETVNKYNIEKDILRLWVKNSDIKKYKIEFNNKYIIYTYKNLIISHYPNAYKYLQKNRNKLEEKWEKKG
jgi:adenine-specific DNA-methyltransferase